MATTKRTSTQLARDRKRTAELALQQFTHQEIADILAQETGIAVSRRQISYDMSVIKRDWVETQRASIGELLATELARIDVLERTIWKAMFDSAAEKERTIVEKVARRIGDADGEDEYEMAVRKITQMLEKTTISPAYFQQIQECQKERRRLLGLYAPKLIGVQKTVKIKSYAEISPGDWPENTIEGELVKED
jgi:intergrase/recombinase